MPRPYAPTAPRFSEDRGVTYAPQPPVRPALLVRLFAAFVFVVFVAAFVLAVHSLAAEADRVAPGCGMSCVPAMWTAAAGE